MIRMFSLGTVVTLIFSIFLFSEAALAESWAKKYMAGDMSKIHSIRQTSDMGYIASGETTSYNSSHYDAWLVKLDAAGNVEWEKTLGGTNDDSASYVQQTSDGGYIATGFVNRALLDPTQSDTSMWISKLASNGDILWHKTYGSKNMNIRANSVQQTSDGGYIVTCSASASVASPILNTCILKFDEEGNIMWHKTYGATDKYELAVNTTHTIGDTDNYELTAIQQTSDGGYAAMGNISTWPFPIHTRTWILKLDSNGGILWQKTYSDINDKRANSIQETVDGGFIIGGSTSLGTPNTSTSWLIKLDSDGDLAWQKSYSTGNNDSINFVRQTSDAGYIAIGNSFYFENISSFPFASQIYSSWASKLDSSGNIQWVKTYGSHNDFSLSAQETSDNGYIIAGNNGSGYPWIFKLDSAGEIPDCQVMKQSGMTAGNADVTITNTTASEVPISFSLQTTAETASKASTVVTGMCSSNNTALPVPSSQEVFSYTLATSPNGGSGSSGVKPFQVYNVNGVLSIQIYIQEFVSPIDIYLAIFAPSYEPDIMLVYPDNSLQPVSAGLVKWREHTKGQIYELLYEGVPIRDLRPGIYYLYAGVTPAGEISNYSLNIASFTLP